MVGWARRVGVSWLVVALVVTGLTASAGATVAAGAPRSTSYDAAQRGPRTVVYPGSGRLVYLRVVDRRLRSTSPAFRRFVKAQLRRAWRAGGSLPGCRQAPAVVVKRWRSDGFALVDLVDSRVTRCGGGGAHAIYVRIGRSWVSPRLLVAQEPYFCTDLRGYEVPRAFSLGDCFPDVGDAPVRYDARAPLPPTTAEYAAATLAANVRGLSPVGAARWADEPVVTQMFEAAGDGATWTAERCFTRSDPTYGDQLGSAQRGCLMRAAYYEDPPPALPVYAAEYVMPLGRGAFGRGRGLSLVGVGSS